MSARSVECVVCRALRDAVAAGGDDQELSARVIELLDRFVAANRSYECAAGDQVFWSLRKVPGDPIGGLRAAVASNPVAA